MKIHSARSAFAVTVILGAVTAGYYYVFSVYRVKQSPPVRLSLVSPNGRNSIEISESVEESQPPATSNSVVRFTAVYSGIRIIDNEPLLVDSPGLQFLSRYPSQVWVSDSILRFIQAGASSEPMPGEVLVINETNKEVSYLSVTAGDMFLLMGLQPKSRIKLGVASVSLQRGELSYLSAKGRFADGSEIREEGVDFDTNGKYANPAHYSIVINNTAVVISSQEFEPYSFAPQ